MKLRNETEWRTDQLRALIRAVALREFDAADLRRIRVDCTYRRRGARICGRAYLNTYGRRLPIVVRLFLDKPGDDFGKDGRLDPVFWAHTIAHEFAHSKGLTHRDMNRMPRYGYAGDWRGYYAWASEHVVERKPQKVFVMPAPAERVENRLQHAATGLRRWESKHKLATTKMKHWRRRVRYYERKLAALRAPKAGA